MAGTRRTGLLAELFDVLVSGGSGGELLGLSILISPSEDGLKLCKDDADDAVAMAAAADDDLFLDAKILSIVNNEVAIDDAVDADDDDPFDELLLWMRF